MVAPETQTAVVHYKSPFKQTVVRYSVDGGAENTFKSSDYALHKSPIHPDWVVFTLSFEATKGVYFVPADGTPDAPYNPDGGPMPKFATQSWAASGRYLLHEGGIYVLADGELTRWSADHATVKDAYGAILPASLPRRRLALFVDIDGTLRGEGKLIEFIRVWERKLALKGAILVFNTGRSEPSVRNYLNDIKRSVVPTAIICRIGTEIRWLRDANGWLKEWVRDDEWGKHLDKLGGWQWDEVLRRVQPPLESHTRVKAHLSKPITRSDPPEFYMTYILTFAVRRVYAGEAVRVAREALGDIDAKLCVSGSGVDDQYLDVVNCGAGKLGGMRFVTEKLGPLFESKNSVMCGDSGNDMDAIRHDGPELAIIVGNAEPELAKYWDQLVKNEPDQKRVVMTKNHCAAGILEGLQTFRFL